MIKYLSIITIIITIILMALLILFFLGISVIGQFWGDGGNSGKDYGLTLLYALLILSVPILMVILSSIFLSKFNLLNLIIKIIALIISIIFVFIIIYSFLNLRNDVKNSNIDTPMQDYELKRPPEDFYDNSNDINKSIE